MTPSAGPPTYDPQVPTCQNMHSTVRGSARDCGGDGGTRWRRCVRAEQPPDPLLPSRVLAESTHRALTKHSPGWAILVGEKALTKRKMHPPRSWWVRARWELGEWASKTPEYQTKTLVSIGGFCESFTRPSHPPRPKIWWVNPKNRCESPDHPPGSSILVNADELTIARLPAPQACACCNHPYPCDPCRAPKDLSIKVKTSPMWCG